MKQRQMDRMLLGISVICFLLMSISFLLMPIESISILPGVLFWIGLVAGIGLQIALEVRRRAFFKSYAVKREKMQKPKNGLLSFGSNSLAIIADRFMIVSFAVMILAFVITKGYGYICYVFIATTIFSFCMHCVLNGRIYFHAKNQLKVRQVLEQKKANSTDKGESTK